MVIEQLENEVVIRLPRYAEQEYLQDVLNLLQYHEVVALHHKKSSKISFQKLLESEQIQLQYLRKELELGEKSPMIADFDADSFLNKLHDDYV